MSVRDVRIVEARLAGATYDELGAQFGLTRQRCQQIVATCIGVDVPRATFRRRRRKLIEERGQELRAANKAWLARQVTYQQLEDQLGISPVLLQKVWADMGLAVHRVRHGHGTYAKYNGGCRCARCRAANSERMRGYFAGLRARQLPAPPVVPAGVVVRVSAAEGRAAAVYVAEAIYEAIVQAAA